MRYWVYINDKVEGPFAEDKLVTLQGFTPDTLICSEDTANSGNQEWVKASAIFEFDQPEPVAPANTAAPAVAAAAAPMAAAASTDATSVLLAKLEAMTTQLTGLQSKLDGMQTKLDESISTQQKAAQEAAARAEALSAQINNISSTRHEDPVAQKPAQLPEEEDISAEEHPVDILSGIDERPDQQPEEAQAPAAADDNILDKGGDDLVLNSALDSLHSHQTVQPQEEKENTFQDLLTPAQAATLAKEAEEKKAAEQKKEEVLAEFSTPAAQENDVLDQVIKEKEEDESKKSMTMRWISAGAAALAGAVGLTSKKDNATKEEPAPADLPELPANQQPEQPAEQPQDLPQEKQTLDFDANPEEAKSLTIASSETPETKAEEPLQTQEAPADLPQAQAAPETQPAPQPQPQEPAMQAQPEGMPSLDEPAAQGGEPFIQAQKDEAPEELVPGAKEEKPDDIITEADLQEAFTERKSQDDASVEQLFGLASAGAAAAAATTADETSNEPADMPSLDDVPAKKQEEKTAAQNNPNDLTEIELKEGSTYLISDFVPPDSATNTPQESQEKQDAAADGSQSAKKDNGLEMQEMVATMSSSEKKVEPKDEAATDETVSQIVLENTIKAKRGAALDIKTLPMVPEPAQSDRLQIEGMDDINTQHDIKSADVEPAGKTAKMVVGTLVALLIAGIIYGMLGFMELIPPQFNILSKQKAAAQQEEQLNEMLGTQDMPTQNVDEAMSAPAVNAQDAILEEVKNFVLPNGVTLQAFVEAKHPAAANLITWEISTAVDPENYSVLVKVPPENPQSFKISYRFNYNAETKALDPTISDAKNLLDSAAPEIVYVEDKDVSDFLALNNSITELSYLAPCLQSKPDTLQGYGVCVCEQNDQKAIGILQNWKRILAKHPQWKPTATLNWMEKKEGKPVTTKAVGLQAINSILQATRACVK